MANVSEQSLWELGVYQIETSDAVIGGVGGIANKQALQLANRTQWLKDQVAGLGTNKQPVDTTLTALANLNTSADRLIYATGTDTFALTPVTAFIRTLLDDADATTARTTLGSAPLASPEFTGTPTAPTAADGTNTTQIASTAFVQAAVGGYLSKAVTGGSITLSDLESSNPVIAFTGALTSNQTVVLPATTKRLWAIYNATSGAFTLTVKTASGTGVTVAQGKRNLVYTDGTNVYDGFNDFENIALTGTPTSTTAAVGTNTTQIATTAYVNAEIAADRPFETTVANIKMDGTQSVGTANTVARGDHVHPTDISRAPLASPTFTGTPTAPTAAAGTSTTQLATTAFVVTEMGNSRPFETTVANIKMDGTQSVGTANTVARGDHVHPTDTSRAAVASPAFTGTPTAPTAADGTNTAQIASTAFVQAAVGGYLSKAVTGGSITLSDLESSNPVIAFTGALTSNQTVVLPATTKRLWAIYNATSGAFTLTVKTASGTGVTVAQGKRNLVYTDGTNVYDGFNDFENIALTGTPTSTTAAVGTNTTQIATTAYVNAEIAADRPFEATAANIKMDGTQSVGTLNTVARGDHVHPTDTTRAPIASPALTGTPTAPTASTGTRTTQLSTTAFVGAECAIAAPVGSVYQFAGATVPTGWLKCNGALLSRTTYAALFAVIGTTYGAGDGSTTFALPDLRGEFVRGADDGRGVDAGRALGSAQLGQNASHAHTASSGSAGGHSHAFENLARIADLDRGIGNASLWSIDSTATQTTSAVGDHTHAITVDASGGNESRPRNVAMHYIIKY